MPVDPLFSSLRVSASGLTANRRWMDTIAENLANAQTTRTDQGGPYRRKIMTFKEVSERVLLRKSAPTHKIEVWTTQEEHLRPDFQQNAGQDVGKVQARVQEDPSDFQWVYDPTHPDANEEGYVAYPNVEVVREMVDLITASRAYEANVTALNAAKVMNKKAMEI
jgi:flagellar basal-body rod protein FlgC